MGIMLIILVAGVVYKMAEMGNRSGILWAIISVAISIAWGLFLPFGFAVGLFGSLITMFICNLLNDPSQSR